jgi:chitinase
VKLTSQPCGGAKPVTRNSKEKDSELCCPISAMPDPKECTWRGSAPSCNGHCEDGEVLLELNRWGSGKYCEDGNKAYCCKIPDKGNQCYWTGMGKECKVNDQLMVSHFKILKNLSLFDKQTFSGTALSTVGDIVSLGGLLGDVLGSALKDIDMSNLRKYCCPKNEKNNWKKCQWYGQPGSCFDNHCPVGKQVQLYVLFNLQ